MLQSWQVDCRVPVLIADYAALAQLVEQLIRNQ